MPKLNEEYLKGQKTEITEKAINTYQLVKLGNIPLSPRDRDRRFSKRSEVYNCANESLAIWEMVKRTEYKKYCLNELFH